MKVKNLDTNISTANDKKLSEDEIKTCWQWLESAEPYTDEEILELPFDGDVDLYRMRAHTAQKILKKHRLL